MRNNSTSFNRSGIRPEWKYRHVKIICCKRLTIKLNEPITVENKKNWKVEPFVLKKFVTKKYNKPNSYLIILLFLF